VLLTLQGLVLAANVLAFSFLLVGQGKAVGAAAALLQFAVMTAAAGVGSVLAHRVRWATRTRLAGGISCLAVFYALHTLALPWPWPLAAAVFFGAYVVLFWIPLNASYMGQTRAGNRGARSGVYFLVGPLLAIVMPLLAGDVATKLGYRVLFASTLPVLLVGAVYALRVPAGVVVEAGPARSVAMTLPRRLAVLLVLSGVADAVPWACLPLLVWGYLPSERSVGLALSLLGVAGALATVLAGRLSDRRGKRLVFVGLAAAVLAPCHLAAAGAGNGVSLLVAMAVANLFASMVPSFLFVQSVEEGRGDVTANVQAREAWINAGRTVGGLAGAGLASLGMLQGVFLASAAALAGVALIVLAQGLVSPQPGTQAVGGHPT
jgi:hypothetical protein